MWSHFVHLFWRTIHGMPLLVSSNWASWGLGLAVFVLYEALAIVFRGWQDMKDRWRQNVGIGLLATAGGYLFLFACSVIVTTYDEHHDSTGRWQAVVGEKNKLKGELIQRDDYLKRLEAKSCPTCPAAPREGSMAQAEKPHKCWSQETLSGPVTQDSLSSTIAVIHCNYHVDAPFCATAKFSGEDFSGGGVFLPGGWINRGGGPGKVGATFTGCISAPSVAPDQLITVTVFGTKKNAVRLLSAELGTP